MHLVDLTLSAFAPSWIAKGSLDLDDDRTSGRAGGQLFGGGGGGGPVDCSRAIVLCSQNRGRD